jgi:hypothetical protein
MVVVVPVVVVMVIVVVVVAVAVVAVVVLVAVAPRRVIGVCRVIFRFVSGKTLSAPCESQGQNSF